MLQLHLTGQPYIGSANALPERVELYFEASQCQDDEFVDTDMADPVAVQVPNVFGRLKAFDPEAENISTYLELAILSSCTSKQTMSATTRKVSVSCSRSLGQRTIEGNETVASFEA